MTPPTYRTDPRRSERGVTLIIFALMITTLLLIVAIVIDLGATRVDRRGGQTAVDAAVASAGKTLAESDAEAACLAGLGFLEATLDAGTFTVVSGTCSDFDASTCDDLVDRVVVAEAGDEYVVEIHNPVLDSSSLITGASVIGSGAIALTADDVDACDRIGMRLQTTKDSFFGGIAGQSDRRSSVHAVAAINGDPDEFRPVNLLILDRTNCEVLRVDGGSTLVVAQPVDDLTKPGVIGVDSNGTGTPSCNGGKSTSTTGGSGSSLVAKGLCETTPETYTCGLIDIFASLGDGDCVSGPSSDDVPACDEGTGSISPNARQSDDRYTRALIDYQYNCKASYTTESWYSSQPIDGCDDAASSQPHVDQLYQFANAALTTTPAGWQVLPGAAAPGFSCNSSGTVVVPQGNYVINCTGGSGFRITGGAVTFQGGNVVFKGKVTSNGGSLVFNACSKASPTTCAPAAPLSWTEGAVLDKSQWSDKAAWVYAPADFSVSTGVEFNKTTLFLDSSATFSQSSSGASVKWVAPDEDAADDSAGPFDDLGLWSRSPSTHTFSGGGSSDFEGLFFAGVGPITFSGSANLTLDDAQFISLALRVTGGGTFSMSPTTARTISFPIDPSYSLIR